MDSTEEKSIESTLTGEQRLYVRHVVSRSLWESRGRAAIPGFVVGSITVALGSYLARFL
jgi:hypothetical protein